jgi:hypothetical protein
VRGISNEVSLGISLRGSALPGADIQNHMRQNVGKEKQKLISFEIF